ncbi:MAG: hypothetical protein M3547_01370 [Acidobacteriota bacterium]|nr:hypothetical protein [Acidobacteriota bacterium]
MSEEQQQPGIRNRIYLGGRLFLRGPSPIELTPERYESHVRVSNLGLRIDRPQTTAGLPNIRNRHRYLLPWDTIEEASLLEHLDSLAAMGQPCDLGIWKHTTDMWDGDSVTTDFLLQRRQLLPSVTPPTAWPDYPTRVLVTDKPYDDPTATVTPQTVVPKTFATIDTGTPAAGEAWIESDGRRIGGLFVSKMRLGTAPPNVRNCLRAIYLPFYKVAIAEERARVYTAGMIEPRAYLFSEA